jgi:hypothetical protein
MVFRSMEGLDSLTAPPLTEIGELPHTEETEGNYRVTPYWIPLAMLLIAALGFFATWSSGKKSAGRIEGIVVTKLDALNERITEHKEQVDDRIDDLKKDIIEDLNTIRATDVKQWERLDEHSSDIGTIKGRLNGKAFGAHQ